MRVRVEGIPKIRTAFRQVSEKVTRSAQREVKRSALNIEGGAKNRVPVDTGRLRNSIGHETSLDELSATIGSNVEYAPFVEFGTRGRTAKPYLFPAFEEERPKFLARLRSAVKDAL